MWSSLAPGMGYCQLGDNRLYHHLPVYLGKRKGKEEKKDRREERKRRGGEDMKRRTVRRVGEGVGGDEVVSREDIVAQLTTLTAALLHVSPPHHQHHNPHYHHKALEVMEKVQGFRVYRAPSRLGGLGVVADTGGRSMVGVCGSVMASGSNGSAVAGLSDDSMAGLSGRQKSLWSASGNLKASRSDGGLSGSLMAEMSTSCEGKTVTGVSDGNATAGVNGDSVLCASGRLMRDMSSKDKTNAPASSDSVLSECDGGAVVVRRGQLVALYPGTLYLPHQPIFFQSIANPFIFRCADGILIDGNDKRLSKFLYKSCCGRDRVGPLATADTSWLTPLPVNPLNIGQYINNQSSGRRSNVAYQEVTLQPDEVSVEERWLLPNLWYSPPPHTPTLRLPLRIVAIVATTDITAGEELLADYFTVIH